MRTICHPIDPSAGTGAGGILLFRAPSCSPRSPRSPRAAAAAVLMALGLLLPAMAGCGRGGQPPAGGPAGGSERAAPAGPKPVEIAEDPVKTGIGAGDAGLAGAVRSRLAADPRLRRQPIEVDAEEGRVTLWGTVGTAQQREAAAEVARRTPGVTSVVDHVKVGTPGGGAP
jgi:hyperosmotically inducible periplasmic protein